MKKPTKKVRKTKTKTKPPIDDRPGPRERLDKCFPMSFNPTALTFNEITQKSVLRCEKDFKHKLNSWSVAEWGNATAGEIGEACNVAKKMLRIDQGIHKLTKFKTQPRNVSRESYKTKLSLEMADAFLYLMLWAASEGIDLEPAIKNAFNNKSRQIGSKIFL